MSDSVFDGFHFGAIICYTALSIYTQIFVWTYIFISLECRPGVSRMGESRANTVFAPLKNGGIAWPC